MEAKDTIIEGMEFLKIAHDGGLDAASKAQAEISFKMGCKEVFERYKKDNPNHYKNNKSYWDNLAKEWGL